MSNRLTLCAMVMFGWCAHCIAQPFVIDHYHRRCGVGGYVFVAPTELAFYSYIDPVLSVVPPVIPFQQRAPIMLPLSRQAGMHVNMVGPVDVLPQRPLDIRGAFNDVDEIRRRVRVLKTSTPVGRERADRLISNGDKAFADQNFARATARYRDAIAKAPDYAEAHFRLAHAYVATRQYTLALKSVLTALELGNSAKRDGFSLEDMYQGDNFVRDQHFQRLIDASLREPEDGGLKFLIGLTQYYGGQRQKSLEQFRAAAALPGLQQGYARYFLPVIPVAEANPIADAK